MFIRNSSSRATTIPLHWLIFSAIFIPIFGFSQLIAHALKVPEVAVVGMAAFLLMMCYLLDIFIYSTSVRKRVDKAIVLKPILNLRDIKKNATIIAGLEIFCCLALLGYIWATVYDHEVLKSVLRYSELTTGVSAFVLKLLSQKKVTDITKKENIQEVVSVFKQVKGGIESVWSKLFNALVPLASLSKLISLILVVASIIKNGLENVSIWILLSPLGVVLIFLLIDLYIHYFNIWRPINDPELEVDDGTRAKIIRQTKKILSFCLLNLVLITAEILSIWLLGEFPEKELKYVYLAIGFLTSIPLVMQVDARYTFWKNFGDLVIDPYDDEKPISSSDKKEKEETAKQEETSEPN
ncbi:hypothetical protein [Candidatus Mycoplasma haematohominis]|uniref:hypothetical protein n=1 Tax=Candidatus Mycoplasma haematohominis TaxID=1494318 RepID=UPI001C0A6F20|nr:hypothetical protein [Candidatus Mycoplasma haemohominis]